MEKASPKNRPAPRAQKDPNEVLSGLFGPRHKAYRKAWAKAESGLRPNFPLHLDVDVTTVCQLRCPMCPAGRAKSPFPGFGLFLPEETYLAALREGQENALPSLRLGMTGEPLLAPRLEEWVQAARKAKVLDVALVTNGQLLTEDMSVKLIQAGLTKLMVSVDAASEETYRLARPGGSYRSLTENLKAFVAVRKALKSPTPLLRLSFVEMSLNQVDRLKFAEEFGELADWLTFQRYLNVSGREDLHRAFSPLEPRPCLEPLTRLALHADGGLFPCCSDFGRLSPLGRFPERSLKSVWLSPAAQALARDQSQFSNCRLCREAQGLAQKAPNLYKPIASFNKIPSPPPGFPGLDPEGR